MRGQILQHERESGSGILEIMNKEGGHRLKGFDLFVLHGLLRKLDIQQAGGGLVADGFEQIEILRPISEAAHAVAESDKAEQFGAGDQRNADAIAAGAEFVGVQAAKEDGPNLFGRIDIERLGMSGEAMEGEIEVGWIEVKLLASDAREGS